MVLAATLLTPWSSAADEVKHEFRTRLDLVEQMVLEAEYKKARGKAVRLEQDMVDRILTGPKVRHYLGSIATLHAVTLADIGEIDHAAWKWWMAQEIDPDLGPDTLARFGSVGETLAEYVDTTTPTVDLAAIFGKPVIDAVVKKNPAPRFPKSQARLKLGGRVVVEAIIGTDGRPYKPRVFRPSGLPVMDYAWLLALRRWKFEPATVEGEPVATFAVLRLNFQSK